MHEPLVTVLMPVFNSEKYLALAIESILNQTFKNLELIVVDDGSADGSNEILQRYKLIDTRVILIEQENRGIVAALNKALFSARGKFCARMDADDVSLPSRIERQFQFMEENPEVFVVGGQGYITDEDGDLIRPLPVLTVHSDIDSDLLNRFNSRGIIHPSVMFRTDEIKRIGGYREDYIWAEDLDLFLRVAEVGKLANLDSVVIHYRKHGNSITDTKSSFQRINAVKAANAARSRRDLPLVSYPEESAPKAGPARIDFMYSTALSALSNGWRRTAFKYLKKMVFEYGLRSQSVKLFLRLVASVIKNRTI